MSATAADRFLLRGGAEIRGTRLAPPEDGSAAGVDPARLVVQTEEGVRLTLAGEQMERVVPVSPAEAAYERLAPGVADTPAEQWKLCQWCGRQGLSAQRDTHLRRILELDPDHVQARHALGFSEVNGEWVLQADYMRGRGYELYRGRWRLKQEVDLARERSRREQAERDWMRRLKRSRERLAAGEGHELAAQLQQLRDPHAVPALVRSLQREPLRPVKRLYLDALQRIGTAAAVDALVLIALNDPDTEVFHECIDRLEPEKPAAAVQAFVKALEDENNVRVNRAANALGRLGDRQVIPPLIAALVTQHKVVIAPRPGTSADTISTTFQRGGGSSSGLGGMSLTTGGNAREFVQAVSNREVLEALTRLSEGVSFGYDQRAWRNWLGQEQRSAAPANLQRR